MSKSTSITGVVVRPKWRAPDDSNRVIVELEGKINVLGRAKEDALTPGLTYEFSGSWGETNDFGRNFNFTVFTQKEPLSRNGVVTYLQKYAPGVGPSVATRLFDEFGVDAVKMLRQSPEKVVAVPSIGRFLTIEKAKEAAAVLRSIAELEDTKIELTNLFSKRGFPAALVEECVSKWGILATKIVRRDPFVMLVNHMPGCGFDRCNRLYQDLGLPLDRLKRQTICIWHVLNSDSSGHTWIDAEFATEKLAAAIGMGGKVRRKKAILLGCRSGWLARKRDESGRLWLAEGDRAKAEKNVAERLVALGNWIPGTEPLETIESGEACHGR
jgi:exodeoxyribonuclease V alpha subunit